MKNLGVEPPPPPPAGGVYSGLTHLHNLYFTAGVGCRKNGVLVSEGRVGKEASLEPGCAAARQCVINLLAMIQGQPGNLNRIERILKVVGFVASAEGFYGQPKVMDNASQLLVDIFGEEAGRGVRSAIGTNVLPNNQTSAPGSRKSLSSRACKRSRASIFPAAKNSTKAIPGWWRAKNAACSSPSWPQSS